MSENNNTGPRGAVPPPSEDGAGRRLPPPAFPPGTRRIGVPRTQAPGNRSDGFISPDDPLPGRPGVPDDAFISPDAPFRRTESGKVSFISPDDPIPHRDPRPALVEEPEDDGVFDPDDVVVTGIGDDAHLDPEELALGGDPHVMELVEQVGKLAEALRHRGEIGLRTSPGMSRFEATLRSYCVGYLAGRRAESDAD